MTTGELVVLVDDNNNEIGTALKSEVHTDQTPLHRAFSVFVFNSRGELLLQQRSRYKKTWPLVWSNSCCGHPLPGEVTEEAVRRRLDFELSLQPAQVWEILPDYRYRAELLGVVEHELCPVYVTVTDQAPVPEPSEVEAIRWVPWAHFQQEVQDAQPSFSPWCIEETSLLGGSALFRDWWSRHVNR